MPLLQGVDDNFQVVAYHRGGFAGGGAIMGRRASAVFTALDFRCREAQGRKGHLQ